MADIPKPAWTEFAVSVIIGVILIGLFAVQIILLVDANKTMQHIEAVQDEQIRKVERNSQKIEETEEEVEKTKEQVEENKEKIQKINGIKELFNDGIQYVKIRQPLNVSKPKRMGQG